MNNRGFILSFLIHIVYMGFFDNPEYLEDINKFFDNELLSPNINYPIGSIVVYSKSLNKFSFFSPTADFNNVSTDFVAVGIVLELMEDLSYIVMYKGFLNQEALQLMDNMVFSRLTGKDKGRYVSSIILNDFNRYCKIYKDNCKYQSMKHVDMMLPSNRHMDLIIYNTSLIIENLSKLIGDDKTEIFYNKLLYERIYCNISGHVAEWKIPRGKRKEFYQEPGLLGGYFLPIMHIKL